MEKILNLQLNKKSISMLRNKIYFNNWYFRIAKQNQKINFDFLQDFKNDKKGKISNIEIWYNNKSNELDYAGTDGLIKAIEKSEGEYNYNFHQAATMIITSAMNEKVKDNERGISYEGMKEVINGVALRKYKPLEKKEETNEESSVGKWLIGIFCFIFFVIGVITIALAAGNTTVQFGY